MATLPFETLQRMADDHRESLMRRSFEQANPEAAAAQAADAELTGVYRSSLSAKEKSRLIERVGYQRYMAIPWDALVGPEASRHGQPPDSGQATEINDGRRLTSAV